MDSITQFVLGAGVGLATLGPKIGPRRAVLVGGILGTVPDLDVFYQFEDQIDSFTLHRGPTHSFFVHAVTAPLFAWGVQKVFKASALQFWTTTLAVFLIFASHAIIDAITIYGTRLFWPIIPDPVGTGSFFIVDPLYTLPLLGLFIWALCRSTWTISIKKATKNVLWVTSLYICWGLGVQQWAMAKTHSVADDLGIGGAQSTAIAMPLTTLAWRGMILTDTAVVNVYFSMLNGQPIVHAYPRGPLACVTDNPHFRRLHDFTDGFVVIDMRPEGTVVSDIRMGITPDYVFQYRVTDATGAVIPPEKMPERDLQEADWGWLGDMVMGSTAPRVMEQFSPEDDGSITAARTRLQQLRDAASAQQC